MAVRASLLVIVLFAFTGLCPETAWAKPKSATFEKMIENSATIAVARFLGDKPDEKRLTILVEVTQVLKGDLKPGKHHVSFEDRPHFGAKDEEFVAFLDKDRVWRFMASPLKGENKVSQGVLQITGFYDYNAYWITPGLVTLDQLKKYLKDGSLVYRFRGEVYFPAPGKLEWKAGSLVVSGTYDVIGNKVKVKGFPNLKGFPAQPEVYIHSRHEESNLDLTYERSGYRPLTLIGKVRGLDNKTGEMTVRFAVSTPEVLTQKAFEDYLADAKNGPCFYKFKLACTPTKDSPVPKAVFLTMGQWTENQWGSTRLDGVGKSPLFVFGTSYNGPTLRSGSAGGGPASSSLPKTMLDEGSKEEWVLRMSVKTEAGDYLTLGFQIGEPKQNDNAFSWTFRNDLLYTLYRDQVKGTITLHDGKTARTAATFTTTLDSVGFNQNEKAEQPKAEAKKKEPAGPVVNGLKLSVSADKTETAISKDGKIEKPVALKLTFTNVSDKPIKFNAYDFNWSRIKGEAKAMPADSVKIQRIAADRILPKPRAGDFFEIKPGQSWSPGNTLAFPGSLPESVGSKLVYQVVKPGEFRVKFTYNSPKIDDPLANGIWIGELVSNEIVVNVKEAMVPKVNEDTKTK